MCSWSFSVNFQLNRWVGLGHGAAPNVLLGFGPSFIWKSLGGYERGPRQAWSSSKWFFLAGFSRSFDKAPIHGTHALRLLQVVHSLCWTVL